MTGRSWREVLGHSLFFMWPRVLDLWLADLPDHKWWREGGSDQFYRYEVVTVSCCSISCHVWTCSLGT